MSSARILVIDGNVAEIRARQQAALGYDSGAGYARILKRIDASLTVDVLTAADGDTLPQGVGLDSYDGVTMTGSALNIYNGGEPVMRLVELAKAVLGAAIPFFGSCWGLQVAVTAAGGEVRANPRGREFGFARRILLNDAGRQHPLYAGKPICFEAPTIHRDEVAALPPGAQLLADNEYGVQAATFAFRGGTFWGVQYHPEYDYQDIAAAAERYGAILVTDGVFADMAALSGFAAELRRLKVTLPKGRCCGSMGSARRCAMRNCGSLKSATGSRRKLYPARCTVADNSPALKKTLGGLHLWGIAVGLVISGEYFGWSYGWASAGTLGFLITTVVIAVMYTTFIFSFTELTAAIPHAGGPFAYSYRAFGPAGGYVAGFSTLIEFVFAPPAIALAIGAYLNVQFPQLSARTAAVGAYAVFMALNIAGVTIAATFELIVTLLAIFELLVFMGVVSIGFAWSHFTAAGWAGNEQFSAAAVPGMFAAIPFAIWFFLAIEGAAMAAEEAKDPRRTVPRAYIGGILTLVALAFGTMIFAGAVGDWKQLANINDPLPQAMKIVVGAQSGWLHLLVAIGLLGLIASFHGIIMGYSRQIFALARAGLLPRLLAAVHPKLRTPHLAILAGGAVGIAAIYSDSFVSIAGQPLTASIVTMSALGAIVMYIMSLLSLMRLRRIEPRLERPFRAPLYPLFPLIALGIAVVSLIAIVYYNPQVSAAFAVLGLLGGIVTQVRWRQGSPIQPDAMLQRPAGD